VAGQVIEGTWDELVRREDLRGRRLRVIVVDEVESPDPKGDDWVARVRQWSDGHAPVTHFVDDGREGIYGGTLDDPR
jgi:hypothetical protein